MKLQQTKYKSTQAKAFPNTNPSRYSPLKMAPTSTKKKLPAEIETPKFKQTFVFNHQFTEVSQPKEVVNIQEYFSFGESNNNQKNQVISKHERIQNIMHQKQVSTEKKQNQNDSRNGKSVSFYEPKSQPPQKNIQIFNNNYNIININQDSQKKNSLKVLQQQFQQILENQQRIQTASTQKANLTKISSTSKSFELSMKKFTKK